MNIKSIVVCLSIACVSSSAFASTKLPFIGTKYFNFDGGIGTGESLTLKKDGTGVVKLYGTASTAVVYKGKFHNPLQIQGENYYKFTPTHVEMLDSQQQPIYECNSYGIVSLDEKHRCIQKLEKR